MMADPSQSTNRFQEAYQQEAPWDIGRPQPPFVAAAEQVVGKVLDAGCGTGELALFFASRGHEVTGIDFLEEPISRARRKAQERRLPVTFQVLNAFQLRELQATFDTVLDCGLFHTFGPEDRLRYVSALAQVTRAGSKVLLMCFSHREPGNDGPRRISPVELHAAFTPGWVVESITETHFVTNPKAPQQSFSPGGPVALFAVIRRQIC